MHPKSLKVLQLSSAQLGKGAVRTSDLFQRVHTAWPGNSLLGLSSPAHLQSGWISPLLFLFTDALPTAPQPESAIADLSEHE